MSSNEITNKVKELRELTRMAEELSAEMDAIKDQLKAHMDAQGVDELAGADFKLTYKEVKSSRFDAKAFKLTHADLYSQYTRETTARRFCMA